MNTARRKRRWDGVGRTPRVGQSPEDAGKITKT
jgi:hypothetical protein